MALESILEHPKRTLCTVDCTVKILCRGGVDAMFSKAIKIDARRVPPEAETTCYPFAGSPITYFD